MQIPPLVQPCKPGGEPATSTVDQQLLSAAELCRTSSIKLEIGTCLILFLALTCPHREPLGTAPKGQWHANEMHHVITLPYDIKKDLELCLLQRLSTLLQVNTCHLQTFPPLAQCGSSTGMACHSGTISTARHTSVHSRHLTCHGKIPLLLISLRIKLL